MRAASIGMRVGVLLFAVAALAVAVLAQPLGPPRVQAAPGDGLTQIVRPAGCTGIGVAFDGVDILYTCAFEAKVHKTDLAGNDTGSVDIADNAANPISVDAIAWDPDLGVLWGGNLDGAGNCRIWTIDMSSGKATLAFSFADPHGGCDFVLFDGLTVDTVTDTLWLSPDVHGFIHHYQKDGTEIAADLIDFAALTPAGEPDGNSGLAIGLDGTLFAGTNGEGKIVEIDNPGPAATFGGVFATVTGRDEDLECGPRFTRTDGTVVETILSADIIENKIDVLEAPEGTCISPTTGNPNIVKDRQLANLWLCNQRAESCFNEGSGVEVVDFDIGLDRPIQSRDPKCEATSPEPETCPLQTIGSFEFEVRFNSKYVSVDVETGEYFDAQSRPPGEVFCNTIRTENAVKFACVTKGKPETVPSAIDDLASVVVRPTADVYSILIANQENGIATQLINQDCQLSDLQGHPIQTDLCDDADVTIRYLEGDIHADCVVDVLDQQQIAFRWGSRLGNLLYSSRMDLEPSAPKKGDGDIDAKDLQFVYGRHGSTCKDPHPAQDPVDPKAKPPVLNGDAH